MRIHTPIAVVQIPQMPPGVAPTASSYFAPDLQMQMAHLRDAIELFVVVAKPPNQMASLYRLALLHDNIAHMSVQHKKTFPINALTVIHQQRRPPTGVHLNVKTLPRAIAIISCRFGAEYQSPDVAQTCATRSHPSCCENAM